MAARGNPIKWWAQWDVWRLIEQGVAADAKLFRQIVEHRQIFFRYSWIDYSTMRPGSLRLLPLEHQLAAWRQDYAAMRTEMSFGPAPEFETLLQAIDAFSRQFNAPPPS